MILQKSHYSQFADIARQMIESAPGNQTDVILGGGMLSFKNGSNSNPKWVCSRQDGRDLIKGYKIDYFNLKIFNLPNFNLTFWNPQYPLFGIQKVEQNENVPLTNDF